MVSLFGTLPLVAALLPRFPGGYAMITYTVSGRSFPACGFQSPLLLKPSLDRYRYRPYAVVAATTITRATSVLLSAANESEGVAVTNTSPTSAAPAYAGSLRIPSHRAASMVRDAAAGDGLLVVACDASGRGGGSKHGGLAAVLRMRCAGDQNESLEFDEGGGYEGERDTVDAVSKRTLAHVSGEAAAVALGMKRALAVVPPERRKTVLILTDSECTLDFYCGGTAAVAATSLVSGSINGNYAIGGGGARNSSQVWKKKRKKRKRGDDPSRIRDEARQRVFSSLLRETGAGGGNVYFAKVRSSSRGIVATSFSSMKSADADLGKGSVEEINRDGFGFLDHDAADYLSSATRSLVNEDFSGGVAKTASGTDDDPIAPISSSFRIVRPLEEEDLEWLENSDAEFSKQRKDDACSEGDDGRSESNVDGSEKFWKSIVVEGSEAREERRQRNARYQRRVEQMLGVRVASEPTGEV